METKLIKFHFIILLILIGNLLIKIALFALKGYNFGLNSYVIMSVVILFGNGISIFILNFKRLFKPFTFLKLYSILFVTIPLLVFLVSNIDEGWSNSILSDFKRTVLMNVPVYR